MIVSVIAASCLVIVVAALSLLACEDMETEWGTWLMALGPPAYTGCLLGLLLSGGLR